MNTYTHSNGTVGVGFLIEFSGKPMHSIAWPNGPAERMTPEEADRKGVKVGKIRILNPATKESDVDSELENELRERIQLLEGDVAKFLEEREMDGRTIFELSKDLEKANETISELIRSGEITSDGNQDEVTTLDEQTSPKTEAELIREYLVANPDADNATVIEALAKSDIQVIASQVGRIRNAIKKEKP